jgi:regulator of protease activity HflC (stomatin/prohibitin superfamily)
MKKSVILVAAALLSGCAVVNQDQIGVKRTLGKLDKKVQTPGVVLLNPLITKVVKLPSRTENLEVRLALPSKEGLNVMCEISILYRIEPSKAHEILQQSGERYVDDILLPVFRSSAADVSARFLAKDMHTAQRAEIERAIREQMVILLNGRGLIVESVLMKAVQLPAGLARAIEAKLEAEQSAQRMEFVIKEQELDAQRKLIEAKGTRDAQKVLSEGLTPMIIQFRQIEALQNIATSPNAKIVITDGKSIFSVGNQ